MAYTMISLISRNALKIISNYTIHLDSKIKQQSTQTYWKTVTFCNREGTVKEY